MKKSTTLATLAATLLAAGMSTAPTMVDNQVQAGISQQQEQRMPTPNRTPAQSQTFQRQALRVQDFFSPVGSLSPMESGLPPKYYGIHLQQTGRQWSNMLERRSRKFRG